MRRLITDQGFTLTELMVVVAIMGFVLSVALSAEQVIRKSGEVTEKQSMLAREVSTPEHVIDKILSQNKQIYNSGTLLSDGYKLSLRAPKAPTVTTYQVRVFEATADGKLTEKIYRQDTLLSAPVYLRTLVWSTHNVNRARGVPMFSYLNTSGAATTPPAATNVLVTVMAENGGKTVSAKRQIYFRNR